MASRLLFAFRMTATFIPAARFRALTPHYDAFLRALGLGSAFRSFELACLERLSFRDVLDVGCGTGELLKALAPTRPEASFEGVDADPEVLAIAREKLALPDPRVRLLVARAEALPFEDASFDLVISSMMLHHLASPAKVQALREWRRVLRHDGGLVLFDLGVPRKLWLKALLWPLRLPILEEQADNLRGRIPGMLAAAGFSFVETAVYRSVVVAYTARPVAADVTEPVTP